MDITKVFEGSIKDSIEFKEALGVISKNFKGKSWLIGSFIYKNIAGSLYGRISAVKDLDFIVENPVSSIKLPPGWKKVASTYENPKFVKDNSYSIDFVPLNNIHSIMVRGLLPSIENYLTGVPLTIQSIAYDIVSKKIIGDIGINAILKKEVSVNNKDELLYHCNNKHISAEDYIQEKASILNFAAIYPKL